MATIMNNRQRYIALNMSRTYCLKVTKCHCTRFSGLKAVEKSLVVRSTLCPSRPDGVNSHNKGIISLFTFSRHRIN